MISETWKCFSRLEVTPDEHFGEAEAPAIQALIDRQAELLVGALFDSWRGC